MLLHRPGHPDPCALPDLQAGPLALRAPQQPGRCACPPGTLPLSRALPRPACTCLDLGADGHGMRAPDRWGGGGQQRGGGMLRQYTVERREPAVRRRTQPRTRRDTCDWARGQGGRGISGVAVSAAPRLSGVLLHQPDRQNLSALAGCVFVQSELRQVANRSKTLPATRIAATTCRINRGVSANSLAIDTPSIGMPGWPVQHSLPSRSRARAGCRRRGAVHRLQQLGAQDGRRRTHAGPVGVRGGLSPSLPPS